VTLPANIPAAKFWSFTVYDNQSRSMLQTRSATRAPEARRTRRRLQVPTRTARRPFTSAPSKPAAQRTATGSRRCLAKAGSRSCAFTARGNVLHQDLAADRDRIGSLRFGSCAVPDFSASRDRAAPSRSAART
jgi:hypothetical protein